MTSVKAGIVLMIYNAVESTITKCLEKLHDVFQKNELKFDDCNDKIKHLVLAYYENAMTKSADINSAVQCKLKLYGYLKGERNFELSFAQLSKFYSLYSGNLDSKEIVSVLEKYGIKIEERISELKTIKENRNKLAHGELTFEEVGRDLTLQHLKKMKEETFKYMRNVISSIEKFIDEEKYKK